MATTTLRRIASAAAALVALLTAHAAWAQPEHKSEMNLVLPSFTDVTMLGMNGQTLLSIGIGVCALGLLFGLVIYRQLQNLPVHKSMREISELIYETCKTYLLTQAKFLGLLEVFIGIII